MSGRKRILSGMRATNPKLHLGNYEGALRNWVTLQDEGYEMSCMVADYHALTTMGSAPQDLAHNSREVAKDFIAGGIDPDKSTLFIQSHVAAHAEACWILNCVTPIGWLERMTQFKDKATGQESISTGLLDYPVLMAGDILLYDAHEVPVGEDQRQHVELARDIAQRFHRIYGDTFIVPEAVIPEIGGRVMGLNDPTAKMSKSYAHIRGHAIRLLDDPREIERSIKRAVTDTGNEIRFSNEPEKAGVNNLLGIYKVITGKTEAEVEKDFVMARGYGDLKATVAEVVIEELTPIRERYDELMQDMTELDRLIARGAEQARAVSEPKMDEIKRRVGLILPTSP